MYLRLICAAGHAGCITIFNSNSRNFSNTHTSPIATSLQNLRQHRVTTICVDRVVASSSVSGDVLYGVPFILYDANDGSAVVVQKQRQHDHVSTHANDMSLHEKQHSSKKNIHQSTTTAAADASLSDSAAVAAVVQSSFIALVHELVARFAVLLFEIGKG